MEREDNQMKTKKNDYQYDFSIIIPHRNSVELLRKLICSIPQSERIEIIVVDNSLTPISNNDIGLDRQYQLLYSSPEKGAGGARNVGLENAHGEWLVFADADDYFTSNAFSLFSSMFTSDVDVVYFCAEGRYIDTGEYSKRADPYSSLIKSFLSGNSSELDVRLGIPVPWSKMIRHELVNQHHIRFDEIAAGNDIYFSLLTGYYAKKIAAIDETTYIVTVSKGTLTKRRDYESTYARLYSKLHCNQFLRNHGLSNRQHSLLFAFVRGKKYSLKQLWSFLALIYQFKQNPFIGCSQWYKTALKKDRDKRYFTK